MHIHTYFKVHVPEVLTYQRPSTLRGQNVVYNVYQMVNITHRKSGNSLYSRCTRRTRSSSSTLGGEEEEKDNSFHSQWLKHTKQFHAVCRILTSHGKPEVS